MLLSVLICFYGKKISVSEFLRSARSSFLLFPIKKENRQRLYNLLLIFILKLILTKTGEQDTLKRPYMSGIMGIVMKLGLTQWESTNRVRLGTKQH